MRAFLREILGPLIAAVVIFLLLHTAFPSFVITGPSMEPSLHNGQRLLVNKVVYDFHEPVRGDVIVFHPPNNPQAEYIKRIIALPGDSVEIKEGTVYVNGSLLDEPYIKDPPNYTYHQEEILDNEYFVLGHRNYWIVEVLR